MPFLFLYLAIYRKHKTPRACVNTVTLHTSWMIFFLLLLFIYIFSLIFSPDSKIVHLFVAGCNYVTFNLQGNNSALCNPFKRMRDFLNENVRLCNWRPTHCTPVKLIVRAELNLFNHSSSFIVRVTVYLELCNAYSAGQNFRSMIQNIYTEHLYRNKYSWTNFVQKKKKFHKMSKVTNQQRQQNLAQ